MAQTVWLAQADNEGHMGVFAKEKDARQILIDAGYKDDENGDWVRIKEWNNTKQRAYLFSDEVVE